MINTIPLLEAQASSEIENIVTTTDKLFQFAQNPNQDHADPATKEAFRYRTALHQGFQELRNFPLATRTAVEVCRTIKGIDVDIRKVSGTVLMNDATKGVVYTPPQGEHLIRELLSDLERFIHDDEEIDPLIRMAVMHYQFEAIHPFSDGNGRTGRILNLLFLIEKGLLDLPILYLSRYIIRNKQDYYRLLLAVTIERQWEAWIFYMLRTVKETAEWITNKIRDIKHLMEETVQRLRTETLSIYRYELVELIFTQPYCRISNVVDAGIAQRATASKTLKELTTKGILTEITVGREKISIHTGLMRILTTDG